MNVAVYGNMPILAECQSPNMYKHEGNWLQITPRMRVSVGHNMDEPKSSLLMNLTWTWAGLHV